MATIAEQFAVDYEGDASVQRCLANAIERLEKEINELKEGAMPVMRPACEHWATPEKEAREWIGLGDYVWVLWKDGVVTLNNIKNISNGLDSVTHIMPHHDEDAKPNPPEVK